MLARLDNEVFFKKAFKDEIVFKAFVKDITGIEVVPEKIETEKAFQPKAGSVNFKYDILAEDTRRGVVIKIQKVEYDHNFDKFLHYHLQAITAQQNGSSDYAIDRTIYTIVVMTAPYKVNSKTYEMYKDEVLITKLNPRSLNGKERKLFNHELIFLNPTYKNENTPQNYKDWLDVIHESIHNPNKPNINYANAGIKRIAKVIDIERATKQEMEQAKLETMKKKVIVLERQEERFENTIGIISNLMKLNCDNDFISRATGLSIDEVEKLRIKIKEAARP